MLLSSSVTYSLFTSLCEILPSRGIITLNICSIRSTHKTPHNTHKQRFCTQCHPLKPVFDSYSDSLLHFIALAISPSKERVPVAHQRPAPSSLSARISSGNNTSYLQEPLGVGKNPCGAEWFSGVMIGLQKFRKWDRNIGEIGWYDPFSMFCTMALSNGREGFV